MNDKWNPRFWLRRWLVPELPALIAAAERAEKVARAKELRKQLTSLP
ncbi:MULTISPECIES: hypothetical protein [unclassified Stenotrophomonas]